MVEVYRSDPRAFHVTVFNQLRDMMVSRKTLKRKIGAALTEKILEMHEDRWRVGQGHLLFAEREALGFDLERFLKDFDFKGVVINRPVPKSGYNPILEQNNGIRLKDYIEARQCAIRPFNFQCLLEKKENLLFSKNEQKFRASGKELKKREHDEANVLEFVEDKITRNDFQMHIDLSDRAKKSGLTREKERARPAEAQPRGRRGRVQGGLRERAGRPLRPQQDLHFPQRLGAAPRGAALRARLFARLQAQPHRRAHLQAAADAHGTAAGLRGGIAAQQKAGAGGAGRPVRWD